MIRRLGVIVLAMALALMGAACGGSDGCVGGLWYRTSEASCDECPSVEYLKVESRSYTILETHLCDWGEGRFLDHWNTRGRDYRLAGDSWVEPETGEYYARQYIVTCSPDRLSLVGESGLVSGTWNRVPVAAERSIGGLFRMECLGFDACIGSDARPDQCSDVDDCPPAPPSSCGVDCEDGQCYFCGC